MENDEAVDECCVCGRTECVEWVDHYGVNTHYASDGFYCVECRTVCDECGSDVYHESIAGYIWDRTSVCFRCAEDRCGWCDDCGTMAWTDDLRWTDYGAWCESCHPHHREPSGESKPLTYCSTCGTVDAHFHLLSEKWLCDHKAREMDPAYVILDHELPNVTVSVA